ncbi:MAG: transcription-repair coupling factor [Syntrophales bacterium]|nr:transcription-repair coupling factor [Syntrophales bacterium]MDP3097757.1 transcription-repair coupling factor [Syntrophales bacterium]
MRKIVESRNNPGDPALRELLEKLGRGEERIAVGGLEGAARAFVIALLFRRLHRPLIVIAPTEKDADACVRDLSLFLGEDQAFFLPPWDLLTTDMFAFQRETELARLEVFHRLAYGGPAVVVIPIRALMQKVIPREILEGYVEWVSVGDCRERDAFVRRLTEGGYGRVTLVEGKGEFSVRGNIIDLFPPPADHPYRLEFFGDELESIRSFDEATQRSLTELAEFRLFPAREVILTPSRRERAVRNIRRRSNELELPRAVKDKLAEMIATGLGFAVNPLFHSLFYDAAGNNDPGDQGLGTLFDYLPAGGLLVLDDPLAIALAQERIENDLDRFILKAHDGERFHLEKEAAYLTSAEVSGRLREMRQLHLTGLSLGTGDDDRRLIRFYLERDIALGEAIRTEAEEAGLLMPLAEKIRGWLGEGKRVVFVCGGQECMQRTGQLLARYDLPVRKEAGPFLDGGDRYGDRFEICPHNDQICPQGDGVPGALLLREGRISGGFHLPGMNLVVLSEEEIFGKKVLRRRVRPAREGYFLKSFGELAGGDFVVHTEHGIGRYRGLQKLTAGGIENDFLLIAYKENDRLYLPVDRIDQIQRYIGPDGFVPKVDKLGGTSWETVKERVKKSVREVAEELVSIYAAREVMDREAFAAPDRIYDEFCASFEFEETPDQVKAIEEIHLDMNGGKPMDRLICGDAGFGKTEVAMRASLRAALDGKQVAVLVPTTILAEQHHQTFSRRLKPYPIRVEVLNRFRTKAEQREILDGLARGAVDIVIGTHRLLQKDVTFRNLGLVIIDEEQRFGVSHKEKLKKLRTLVDVLTLTATPIPRTLHLSLVGIRDLSIINTAPEDRLPVKTHVLEFNEEVIADAIRRELARNGQSFFLHDRVRSIFTMARLVQKLVPEAQVGVVHGRMKPTEIEGAMARFVRREDNVLVCTSIIGSGLDIPTANTIIINRADRFGLAQLYQIRGRVGRSKEEASAYLLVPKGAMLSRDAQKRLQVIMDFTEPGSGFRIASNDLEIRGAGSLLGISQSGHVSAVGYELYTELMDKAIREIKGEPAPEEEVRPEIHLGIPAFIPEAYMADEHRRLVTYKRVSLTSTDEELDGIHDELLDCYGLVPLEVENLLAVIGIRNLLKTLKGKKMGYDGRAMSVFLQQKSPVDPVRIIEMYRRKVRGVQLSPDLKLTIPMPGLAGSAVLTRARELLQELRG